MMFAVVLAAGVDYAADVMPALFVGVFVLLTLYCCVLHLCLFVLLFLFVCLMLHLKLIVFLILIVVFSF